MSKDDAPSCDIVISVKDMCFTVVPGIKPPYSMLNQKAYLFA